MYISAVQQHHRRPQLPYPLEPLGTFGAALDLMAELLEHSAQGLLDPTIVVNDENCRIVRVPHP